MPGTVTPVSVANSALIKLGCDRISALSEQTKSAILINAIYSTMRDDVLRGHPWRFARRRSQITAVALAPEFEFEFAFDLPNDCLRVWEVSDEDDNDEIDWVAEGTQILANTNILRIVYVKQEMNEGVWDTLFAETLSCRLATEIGYAMTQSAVVVQEMEKLYQKKLAEARAISGMEGILKGLVADTWTNSRG